MRVTVYQPLRHRAFTLVELMATVAIAAMVVSAAVFFVANYITYSHQQADRQTLWVLNDALTRYKTQGGNVSTLYSYSPVGAVLAGLQTALTWAGHGHIVLAQGITYPARSIDATGSKAQYHFYRFNTYNDGSPGSNGTGNSTVNITVTDINCSGDYDPMQFFLVANGIDIWTLMQTSYNSWVGDGVQIHWPPWLTEKAKTWYTLTPSFYPYNTSTITCSVSVPPGNYELEMWDVVDGAPPNSNSYLFMIPAERSIYVAPGTTVNINANMYDDGAITPNFWGGYVTWP